MPTQLHCSTEWLLIVFCSSNGTFFLNECLFFYMQHLLAVQLLIMFQTADFIGLFMCMTVYLILLCTVNKMIKGLLFVVCLNSFGSTQVPHLRISISVLVYGYTTKVIYCSLTYLKVQNLKYMFCVYSLCIDDSFFSKIRVKTGWCTCGTG